MKTHYTTGENLPSFILICNKMDLSSKIEGKQEFVDQIRKSIKTTYGFTIEDYFEVSCMTGEGIDNLRAWLIKHFNKD